MNFAILCRIAEGICYQRVYCTQSSVYLGTQVVDCNFHLTDENTKQSCNIIGSRGPSYTRLSETIFISVSYQLNPDLWMENSSQNHVIIFCISVFVKNLLTCPLYQLYLRVAGLYSDDWRLSSYKQVGVLPCAVLCGVVLCCTLPCASQGQGAKTQTCLTSI